MAEGSPSIAIVDDDPAVLKAFLEASYMGWRDVMADPKAALEIFKKRVPEIDLATIAPNMEIGVGLMKTDRYAKNGIAPGGTHANFRFLADWVTWPEGLDKASRLLLCDAQTSGGLLIAVAPEKADALVAELTRRDTSCAAVIGALEEGPAGQIRVI